MRNKDSLDLKYFLYVLSVFYCLNSQAQRSQNQVDRIMSQIPSSRTKTIQDISSFILEKFSSDSNKLRAAFIFTAQHLDYDVENMYAVNFNELTENKIEKGLKTRKGVCMHYAEIFNALAKKLGLESYVIEGLTKQNGATDAMSHAWNAVKVHGSWYLFDPTWSSGEVYQGKFVKKLDNKYYKVKPEKLIKTHYPFDYLWQFSSYPLKANDFLYNRPSSNKVKINYEKILATHSKQNEIERLRSTAARIEENGLSHSTIFDRYQHIKQMATILPYNESVNDYNESARLYNMYINYRNAKFTPTKSDADIKEMIVKPKQLAEIALAKIESIPDTDQSSAMDTKRLQSSIADLLKNIVEQENFVNEYIQTKPNKRKNLFYTKTVSIFGIPLTK